MTNVKQNGKTHQAIVYFTEYYGKHYGKRESHTAMTRIGHCLHMLETYGNDIKR